ncbi:MAG: hypothetical protein GDA65_19480 [Nitrospira sp. CR1.1]|nr:hypothetical protein [Nitrospira sp. CR1.1]
MEASLQGSRANRLSGSEHPSSTVRCGKDTGASASHTDQSVQADKTTKQVDKENPLNLEPHPILAEIIENTAEPNAIDAFSKDTLEALMASLPMVEVVSMKGRYCVIRGWEFVRLARRHKVTSFLIQILTFSTTERLRDYIYLTCLLATQLVPVRELSAFRASLNKMQIKSKSKLLTGSPAQQLMNGLPISTGYRLKGPTPGTTRGRKKKPKPADADMMDGSCVCWGACSPSRSSKSED